MRLFDQNWDNFPFKLSDKACTILNNLIGPKYTQYASLFVVALMHPSFINEHKNELEIYGINLTIPDLLEELGLKFVELMLAQDGCQICMTTPGDLTAKISNKSVLFETLAQYLLVLDIGLIGKGLSSEIDINNPDKPRSVKGMQTKLICQIIGMILLLYDYDLAYSMFSNFTSHVFQSEKINYKREAQNYVQSKKLPAPIYVTLDEMGLDYSKKFLVEIQSKDGKCAQGWGTSKHDAQKTAAQIYLEKYGKNYLSQMKAQEGNHSPNFVSYEIPPLHKDFIIHLSNQCHFPEEKRYLLSQALTIKSFLNETKLNLHDNLLLSFLGSYVLNFLITYKSIKIGLETDVNINYSVTDIRGFLHVPEVISKGYDILVLKSGVLMGKGQFTIGISETMKMEIFQAVIGAMFYANPFFLDFEKNIPLSINNWLNNEIKDTIQKRGEGLFQQKDPKTLLQEFLQAIQLASTYSSEKTHVIKNPPSFIFETKVIIWSKHLNKKYILQGGKGISTKNSERAMATLALEVIKSINFLPDTDWRVVFNDSRLHILINFLLLHELVSIPANFRKISEWYSFGLLGSQQLSKNNYVEFIDWANSVEDILLKHNDNVPNIEGLKNFYHLLHCVDGGKDQQIYTDELYRIGEWINKLDVDNHKIDLRDTPEFRNILSLSLISKLLGKPRCEVYVRDVIRDVEFFQKKEKGNIQFILSNENLKIYEHEGVSHAFLSDLLKTIYQSHLDVGVTTSVDINVKNQYQFDIIVIPASNFKNIESFKNSFENEILWQFYWEELTICSYSIQPERLKFECSYRANKETPSLSNEIIIAYRGDTSLNLVENVTKSNILHDLKNQLIAFQVCMSQILANPINKTYLLKQKYEASVHLDSIHTLMSTLNTIRNATSVPIYTEMDINVFFRNYISLKYTEVPSNVRLVPPISLESHKFITSFEFVKSILDNIVKNAIEAMVSGGDIQIDWLFDEVDKLLLIEVSDNGPGIPVEILEKLQKGETIKSQKEKGSGIGIMTIYQMTKSLGGKAELKSSSKGTTWTIQLPSYCEETEEESALETTVIIPEEEEVELNEYTLG